MSTCGRVLSLRTLTGLIAVGLALYIGGFSLPVVLRIRSATAALDRGTAPIPHLFGEMSARAQALYRGVLESHRPPPPDSLGRVRSARALRAQLMTLSNRATPGRFADVPDAMRHSLARADDLVARLQSALFEYTALVELGRLEAAAARRATALTLAAELQRTLAEAQRLGVNDLLSRQQELTGASAFAFRAVVWWLLIGAVVVGLLLVVVGGRFYQPLNALYAGLGRVADGDLSARVPVARRDELGRLAEHFNEMTAVLQRRAHEQGRFVAAGELLAGVAHEVNNPLMAIAATAEGRLADATLVPAQRQEYELVLRQARRAGKLLKGLLRFVRPGEEPAQGVDVNGVLRAALDLVSFRLPVDEIAVDTRLADALPPARVQASRLEQVFVNLLSNAIDALVRVPTPRVLQVSSGTADGQLWIAVEDNGPGIVAEVHGQLFRPFATSKGMQGTGLGLYISREIARAAGGDVTLEARSGRGTRFVVRLPASGCTTPGLVRAVEPVAPAPGDRPLQGIQVLLVDDEEPVRSAVARYLRKRGAQVAEAADGYLALEHLIPHGADVVVADLRMPRMDGPTLYAQLEARDPALAERVLFLSGDISQLGELGATPQLFDRVLAKPVELPELEERILRLAERAAAGSSQIV